jgi:hypothetical protein
MMLSRDEAEARRDKREKRRAHYEANREKEQARQKVYREVNREEEAARHKAYREANPISTQMRDAKGRERAQARQSFSAERAVRSGLRWAAWEDAEVVRDGLAGLTVLETALRLGRTVRAIRTRRHREERW